MYCPMVLSLPVAPAATPCELARLSLFRSGPCTGGAPPTAPAIAYEDGFGTLMAGGEVAVAICVYVVIMLLAPVDGT